FILILCYEVFVQSDNLELVASLYQEQELFLRHDLAVFSVTVCILFLLVIPWELYACQLFRMNISDVGLVRPVFYCIIIRTQVRFYLFQVFGLRIYDHFRCLCGSVIIHHVRSMYQYIARSLDYTVHWFSTFLLFIKYKLTCSLWMKSINI